MGAGSVVQLLSALAGLAAIPVIVHALGTSRFGVLVVIVSLAPWLTLVDGALYGLTRLLVGEYRSGASSAVPRGLMRRLFRRVIAIAAGNAATLAVGLLVLPLVALFGADGVAERRELVLAVLCFAAPVILSGPGGIYLGALEGVGRTVAAAVISGLGPIVALPLLLAVAAAGGGLVSLCAVQGLAVALPRLCAWVYWNRRPSWSPAMDAAHPLPGRLVWHLVVLSTAALVQAGLDPVIVSSALGSEAAASFGLAARVVAGALIPLAVLTPLFASNLAEQRAVGWSAASDAALRLLLLRATLAGVLVGAAVALLGPALSQLLGAGRIQTPTGLYVAGGAFALTTFAAMPLYLAFSGPSGLARSVRLNAALTVSNVFASLVLVRVIGPAGPLWASAGAALVAVVFWLLVWRQHPEYLAERHIARAARSGDFPD